MGTTLKERVEKLEQQVAELSKALELPKPRGKPGRDDWKKTFGMSANDPGFEEMVRLGREWRERQRPRPRRQKPNAGS